MLSRLVVTLGLLAIAGGCGKDYSKPVRPGTTPVPRELEAKLEVPASFPSEILLYPGATLVAVDTEGEHISLNYETPDKFDQVLDTLREELPKKGWTISVRPTTGGVL